MSTKRLKEFKSDRHKVESIDMANMFNVYNRSGVNTFNINKTMTFPKLEDIPVSYYTEHQILAGDQWSFIAHDGLGDWKLWWIIAKFNGIVDPTQMPPVGSVIKIPTEELVKYVLNDMVK